MNRRGPLLAAICAVTLLGCATTSLQERQLADAHYGLAQQSLGAGDPRAALEEIQIAVEHDPKNAEVRNLYGLLLHVSFNQTARAEAQYREALSLRRDYSEAKVNLSALLTAQGRCQEAIPLLEEAREDLLFREPHLVENNLGWCKYQLGDVAGGLAHLQQAVSTSPGFCLGHRNLGQALEEQGRLDEALHSYRRYRDRCPGVADADHRIGLVHLERGDQRAAREAFLSCEEKATGELADQCGRKAALLVAD